MSSINFGELIVDGEKGEGSSSLKAPESFM